MTEKNNKTQESDLIAKPNKVNGFKEAASSFDKFFVSGSMLFISLTLVVHAGFFVLLFLHDYDPGHPQFTAIFSIYLVFALYNLIGIVGILYRKGFGKTLGEILIIFDFVMSIRYPWFPLSLILSIISYILFHLNTKAFRKPEEKEKYVYYGMVAALLIPVILLLFPSLVPKLHTDPADVTREAIEKNDVKICDKLVTGKDECIRIFAETKKDSRICGIINSDYHRDICYLHLADELDDSQLCELIKNDYDKKMCNWVTGKQ